ncbi:lysosomal alpha-mannosidase [Dorcoceras hygrometricum]|uniref:Lysosomal alpha-mannosidase n=1 Tax=Dorcoceras hygrometricum TaxID=472368 RepID=A0A2Z7AWY4_9LAMI|nr:lysosomal alpha-mannosidase [Dorcoceras hygrometricum]
MADEGMLEQLMASIPEAADEEAGLAPQGGASTAAEEGPISEDVETSGAARGSGAEAQAESAVGGTIVPSAKGKELLMTLERTNLVTEHCTEVLKAIHEQVEPWVTKFDQWKLFRTEVRLKTILSMTPVEELTNIEDDMMVRAETEWVFDMLMRHELIRSTMVVELLQKSVEENWKSFDLNKPSANQDLMSISRVEIELK